MWFIRKGKMGGRGGGGYLRIARPKRSDSQRLERPTPPEQVYSETSK